MAGFSERFNAAVPAPVRLVLVVVAGGLIYYSGILKPVVVTLWAAGVKVSGNAPNCPWTSIITFYPDLQGFTERILIHKNQLRMESYDEAFDIQLLAHSGRDFWIRKTGGVNGVNLLSYHLGEHDWIASRFPEIAVRDGDVVVDCGAHVGVFVHEALSRGAAKVIAIDPDPTQVECLRRNFRKEIAEGRVLVVPEGVWSSEGTMKLYIGSEHSGLSSMVEKVGDETLTVPVTTIDALVKRLGLKRVDFVKIDIEGAEREALQGASETLKKYRPRLLVDSYHRPDDVTALPKIIKGAWADYEMTCGWCELDYHGSGRILPHVQFYQ